MKHLPALLIALLLLAGVIPITLAQTPQTWRQQQLAAMDKSDAIMKRAHGRKDLLAQYQVMRYAYAADGSRAFRAIFGQYLSWYQSFIGDYKDAETGFSIQQKHLTDDAPSPVAQPGWHPLAALDYIPILAKNYRVVFLNEAHNIALTRTLTVRLLKPLHDEGFNVFAVETLYHKDIAALNQRGYPVAGSGFYTREPVYAEMVRTALKLGYKVVAYEADPNHVGDAREAQQAKTLWKILKQDPNAKLVVNAGYAHIKKTGKFLGARSMAEHFIDDSGITPLSIEQTILIPHQDTSLDHPYYAAIIAATQPHQPIVFVNKGGRPWSLRPGYDASVIFPPQHFMHSRPTWLGLWGARVPVSISGKVCRHHYPCMVAARPADEGKDAVPSDRMVLDPIPLTKVGHIEITDANVGVPVEKLYLRPGKYRLAVSDANGDLIGRRMIAVEPTDTATRQPASAPESCLGISSGARCLNSPMQP